MFAAAMNQSKPLRCRHMDCQLKHLNQKFESLLGMLEWRVLSSPWLVTPFTFFVCASTQFQDLSATVLPIRGYEDLSPADYKLVFGETNLADDGLPVLYILAPRDLIVAFPRGVLDHIDWCAERGEYEVLSVSFLPTKLKQRLLFLSRKRLLWLRNTRMHCRLEK
jgi:hypothetical protein